MAKLKNIKQISFSDKMLVHVEERIKDMGINFPEYIRYLVLADTKPIRDKILLVTAEEEASIEASMKDLQYGNFTTHKNKGDIRKHFSKLKN